MLTGDNWATARRIAADLGIEQVFAEILPRFLADLCASRRPWGPMGALLPAITELWPWRGGERPGAQCPFDPAGAP